MCNSTHQFIGALWTDEALCTTSLSGHACSGRVYGIAERAVSQLLGRVSQIKELMNERQRSETFWWMKTKMPLNSSPRFRPKTISLTECSAHSSNPRYLATVPQYIMLLSTSLSRPINTALACTSLEPWHHREERLMLSSLLDQILTLNHLSGRFIYEAHRINFHRDRYRLL